MTTSAVHPHDTAALELAAASSDRTLALVAFACIHATDDIRRAARAELARRGISVEDAEHLAFNI